MPNFSDESKIILSLAHPELQIIFNAVVKTFDCKILTSFRAEKEQREAFKSGKSKLDWPRSKHNSIPSRAVDVAPWPLEMKNINRFYWFAGYVMGIAQKLREEGIVTHRLRYGGDWNQNYIINDQDFNDLLHYELIEGD